MSDVSRAQRAGCGAAAVKKYCQVSVLVAGCLGGVVQCRRVDFGESALFQASDDERLVVVYP